MDHVQQAASATHIAAIFDMDGTLVDNMPYHVDSWAAFSRNHDLPFSLETFYETLNGRTAKDTLEILFGRALNAEEIHRYTEEKEELYRQAYRPHLTPLAGLVPFLTDLKAHGVRLAVATSAPLSNVDFTLNGAGIADFFDAVVYGGMVQRGKPDPEIYLLTAQKLGIEPSHCVVFEDALLGIESAQRAGMTVVGITTSHPPDELAPLTVRQQSTYESIHFELLTTLLSPILSS